MDPGPLGRVPPGPQALQRAAGRDACAAAAGAHAAQLAAAQLGKAGPGDGNPHKTWKLVA